MAAGCVEIGRSGRVYDRAALLEALGEPTTAATAISDLAVRPLSPDVMLVTYRSERKDEAAGIILQSRRASVWVRWDSRWALAFHQGTPIA